MGKHKDKLASFPGTFRRGKITAWEGHKINHHNKPGSSANSSGINHWVEKVGGRCVYGGGGGGGGRGL